MNLEQGIAKFVDVIISPTINLIFSVALLVFVWGIFRMIMAAGSGSSDLDDGKKHMLYGLIGMLIMFGVGGIISIINGTIGSNGSAKVQVSQDL